MQPNEHTMLNRLRENMGSLAPQHHGFVNDMQSIRLSKPYWRLSQGQRAYLTRLYASLLAQGIVDAIAS